MTDKEWKPGQTCTHKGAWGHIAYLMAKGQVVITLDRDEQRTVPVDELENPLIRADGPATTVQYSGLAARAV